MIGVSTSDILADSKIQGPMIPLANEKLAQVLTLTGVCKDVKIVEWRPTPGFALSTSYSANALQLLNQTCQKAVNNFYSFLIKEGWHLPKKDNFAQSIALMPANLQRHGADYRNLNDSFFRFFSRTKEYDEDGDVIAIWGYQQRAINYIYIRNDVYLDDGKHFNSRFVTIFSHELGHALSNYYGVYSLHKGNKNNADERLAVRFTKFLNVGE